MSAGAESVAEGAPPAPRIAQLDVVRGVAVMGILAMNIVAFAMPFQAYMNPTAYGMQGPADLISWFLSFIFIDGKMRGLFSFLFGASTLLVIQRAQAAGADPARSHYLRMAWLLVFGLIHFYLIWFGDILVAYALVGMLLYLFKDSSPRKLIGWGIALVAAQCLLMAGFAFSAFQMAAATAGPNPDPDTIESWNAMREMFAPLASQALADNLALFRGAYSGQVQDRLVEHGTEPFTSVLTFGWETLAYMLFGMAALKTGFFKGEWPRARYLKIALIGLAVSIPVYAVLAWLLMRSAFAPEMVIAITLGATTPFRPLMVLAYAALIILLARPGGFLTARIAATGRAAFTNYLGTSLLMTALFYGWGLGLYGSLSRAQLWLPVLAMWLLMLLWSKPWLERFNYGPFEWLWRSLARMAPQPMRKTNAV